MSNIRIGIDVQADINKLRQLSQEVDNVKKKFAELGKANGSGGASLSSPSFSGKMPLAGAVIPPPIAALSHRGMAQSGMSPVMWGPAFRANMHQMMPGHYAHQTGASAALAQLQGKTSTLAATSTTTSTSSGLLQRLTTALDRLTMTLTKPKSTATPISSVTNMNPFVTLQSEQSVLQALSMTGGPSSSLSMPKSISYTSLNPMQQRRIRVASQKLANGITTAPSSRSSITQRLAHAALTRGIGYEGASLLGASGLSAGAMLAMGGGAALGIGALSWLVGKTGAGWNTYQQSAPTASNLWHTLSPSGGFNTMYNRITGAGYGNGISNAQSIQAAQMLAATGGNTAVSNANLKAVFGGAIGLGYGANGATTLAQQMAELQRLGITSGLSATATNRSAIFGLGNATVTGGMQGRTDSILTGITSLIQTLDQQRTTAPNFAKLLGMMTTLSSSGLQALQGQRGANLLSTFNSSLTNPGGGAAGQLYMYNALTSGTNLSPFGEMYLAQQGLTGSYGGQTNLQRVMQYSLKMFPSLANLPIKHSANGSASIGMPTNQSQLTALAYLSNVFGMSMPQTQAFMGQFTHNGKFSMTNMNAESNWWGNIGGMPKSASMAVAAAQLFNSRSSAKGLASVMNTMKSGGFTFSTQQEHLLSQARSGNTSAMKQLSVSLGHEMQNGRLLTAEDQLIKSINNNNTTWAKIGQQLLPLVTDLNRLATVIGDIFTPGSSGSNSVTPAQARFLNQQAPSSSGSTTIPGGSPSTAYKGSLTVSRWTQQINAAAKKNNISPDLIAAVMQHESGGNPNAQGINYNSSGQVSSVDAGLMQINSMNWKKTGLSKNPYDPLKNILVGAEMLSNNIKKYGLTNGLAAYNGGTGGMHRQVEQQYAAIVEGIMRAFQKQGTFNIHVHVPGNTASAGLAQYAQAYDSHGY